MVSVFLRRGGELSQGKGTSAANRSRKMKSETKPVNNIPLFHQDAFIKINKTLDSS